MSMSRKRLRNRKLLLSPMHVSDYSERIADKELHLFSISLLYLTMLVKQPPVSHLRGTFLKPRMTFM